MFGVPPLVVAYSAHMVPLAAPIGTGSVAVAVEPVFNTVATSIQFPPVVPEDAPNAAATGVVTDDDEGTYTYPTSYHVAPVPWPTLAMKLPPADSVPVNTGAVHTYPGNDLHVVPTGLLNMPSVNIAARTIAIINIAHPYVIKYSIALCARNLLVPIDYSPIKICITNVFKSSFINKVFMPNDEV
jgi:hypothetical protein